MENIFNEGNIAKPDKICHIQVNIVSSEPEIEQAHVTISGNKDNLFNPEPVKINVFDVASYILKKLGKMTTMKLHKLVYYCQAWSLVWDEKPLFDEKIEAWANGPVIPELFSFHRGYYSIENIQIGRPQIINEEQKKTIDPVLEYYGNKSSQWLIELTHLENPWKNARVGLSPDQRGNRIITLESMAEYYSSL